MASPRLVGGEAKDAGRPMSSSMHDADHETASMLRRIGSALRTEIQPVLADPMLQSQASKAAVILERVSRELDLSHEHHAAQVRDVAALSRTLADVRPVGPAPRTAVALERLGSVDFRTGMSEIVAALYAEKNALGPAFTVHLDAVRATLRADLNRRLLVAQ